LGRRFATRFELFRQRLPRSSIELIDAHLPESGICVRGLRLIADDFYDRPAALETAREEHVEAVDCL